jgi:hypothetical protein
VPHNVTDVQAWDADFLAFSSHKLCGPSGIGVLWGREELLDAMPPFLGGGNMIADVSLDGFTTAELPAKFEAGTPPIIEAVGFGAAVDFLDGIGMDEVRRHEMQVADYALRTLTERFGDDITIHGPTNVEQRGATFSFAFRGIHPHDLSPGARPAQRVRARRPPLRQAADAHARRGGHGPGELLPVQRRVRGRRAGRCARQRNRYLRVLRPAERKGSPCPASKTSTARSSSTTTAPPEPWRAAPARRHATVGHNPLCGDEIEVYLDVDDGVVHDIKVGGQGCSISQSSASMMSQAVKGKTVAEVRALVRRSRG